jgi:predicted phosphohydrolase
MIIPSIPIFATNILRIVCVSDTHNDNAAPKIPPGDILIHAGDMTDDGTIAELQTALSWISSLPHAVKVIVAGESSFDYFPHISISSSL